MSRKKRNTLVAGVLYSHNFVDIVPGLARYAVQPIGTAIIDSVLDSSTASIISGESLYIIPTIFVCVASHQFSGSPQRLNGVPGINAQPRSRTRQELRNTYCSGGRDCIGIESAFRIDLPYKIVG